MAVEFDSWFDDELDDPWNDHIRHAFLTES